jgi:hypothetical protein
VELAELDAAVEARRECFNDARTKDWLSMGDQQASADRGANEEYEQDNAEPVPAAASASYRRIGL